MIKQFFLLLFVLTLANAKAQFHAVVISEFMADPTPGLGLPEYEWIELYNRTDDSIQLQGWRIRDRSGQTGPLPSFLLAPKQAVIVAGSTAAAQLNAFANCLAVTNWISLDNAGDLIAVYNNSGELIFALEYTLSWYKNELKAQGGWSIEMQQPDFPCWDSFNWRASEEVTGSSPGVHFSHNSNVGSPPLIWTSIFAEPNKITLRFSHIPDAFYALKESSYRLQPALPIREIRWVEPLRKEVEIICDQNIDPAILYELSILEMRDCANNFLPSSLRKFGLPQPAEKQDIVISELLFHPPAEGSDYIEIYNRSNKVINLAELSISSRNSALQIQSAISLSKYPELLLPGEYRAFTIDTTWLLARYGYKGEESMRILPSLPSWPDKTGWAVLLGAQQQVIDELNYDEKMHYALLSSFEAVALERVNLSASSDQIAQWYSASSTSHFGTPGYENSQQYKSNISSQAFFIDVKRLSPNHDGHEDFLTIRYYLSEPGWMAQIFIFDAAGRTVRILQPQTLLGTSGSILWDGLDDRRLPLAPGIYIVWMERFNLTGQRKISKQGVILSDR